MSQYKSDAETNQTATSLSDHCQRFLFSDADVRGEIVRLTRSYTDTVNNHAYPPAVRKLLGEFLAAAALLGSTIKYEGRLVLQVRGDGELTLIMSECTSEGALRGIARYQQVPQLHDFDALTGNGVLVITVDSRHADTYQGIVSLEGGSLAASLKTYFEQSEQLQSWFYFAADEDQVCGFMLQQLPSSRFTDSDERAHSWEHLLALGQTLTAKELHELRARALISIGKEEVDSIVAEHGSVNIACEFCGTDYHFNAAEIELLMQDRGELLH
jgi:molecular chaperone Hsp33